MEEQNTDLRKYAVYVEQANTAIDVPNITDWATYGTNPGVLVGVIVISFALIVMGTTKAVKWLLMWHIDQLNAMRISYEAELTKCYDQKAQLLTQLEAVHTMLEGCISHKDKI